MTEQLSLLPQKKKNFKNLSYKNKEVKYLGARVLEFNKGSSKLLVGIADTNVKHNFNYKIFWLLFHILN